MEWSRGVRTVLLLLSVTCTGCRACTSIAKTAPREDVEKVAREELARSPEKLSTICGVRVSALKDMVVSVVKSEWAKHTVHVEGTAVPVLDDAGAMIADDDETDDDEGGTIEAGARKPIVVNPTKAILCVGVVVMTIDPILDEHGNGTGWHATGVEVDSVATAGVAFEKAKHGHHHHHHHH